MNIYYKMIQILNIDILNIEDDKYLACENVNYYSKSEKSWSINVRVYFFEFTTNFKFIEDKFIVCGKLVLECNKEYNILIATEFNGNDNVN